MKAVLFLASPNRNFQPILKEGRSASFLPVNLEKNLLSLKYTKLNSYFSKDKIYVSCTPETLDDVKKSCRGISEENIIIEPAYINYSISMYYASLVLNKISPDSIVLYMPGHFLFKKQFKIENWLYAVSEIAEKDWVIVPSVFFDRTESHSKYIDAGKIFGNVKKTELFLVNKIFRTTEEIKRRKIFGKQGKILYIVCSKVKSLTKSYLSSSKNSFFSDLQACFKADIVDWNSITKQYDSLSDEDSDYDFFSSNKDFLTTFFNIEPDFIDSWAQYYEIFALQNTKNILHGNVNVNNCSNVITFNYDEDEVYLENLTNTVCFKKNGLVAIKNY